MFNYNNVVTLPRQFARRGDSYKIFGVSDGNPLLAGEENTIADADNEVTDSFGNVISGTDNTLVESDDNTISGTNNSLKDSHGNIISGKGNVLG